MLFGLVLPIHKGLLQIFVTVVHSAYLIAGLRAAQGILCTDHLVEGAHGFSAAHLEKKQGQGDDEPPKGS